MQYYRDGYRPGSPDMAPAEGFGVDRSADLPDQVDVLIVGTGPAGTVLAAQLAAFPDINTRIVERRDGPLEVGQADGVACRTVEMFEAFGLSEALLREAYWVNEVRFWGPSESDRSRIVRTGWVEDTPDGLSEFPHVIVNQARMQQFLLDHAAASASRLTPDYGVELVDLTVGEGDYPVAAILARTAGDHRGEQFTVRARYVVGCDGARSGVRRAIGLELHGDAANHAWGVIDVLATTDFPDWRTKNVVQSAGKGSLIMIPREGGNMVRLYVDLGEVAAGDSQIRQTSVDQITAIANDILSPFRFTPKSVAWSSVYEVGQRLAERFDDVRAGDEMGLPRVFIAGDACHTHSAKAGQGMNVAMQDAFNLGWKLGAVLRGAATPSLLRSYTEERQRVAAELIEFDRFWSAFVAQPMLDPERPELGGVSSADMRAEFARQTRYTAGLATRYPASTLTGSDDHQSLATGFEVGTRFHSAPVVRVADALRTELGHAHRADGRWRIYAFADGGGVRLMQLASWLSAAADSPVRRFTPANTDIDSIIDVHAVLRDDPHDIELSELPPLLLPTSGTLGLQDWEKVWSRVPSADIFSLRGIADEGAAVVVRPDQYVAHVLPLDARAELTELFGRVLVDAAADGKG